MKTFLTRLCYLFMVWPAAWLMDVAIACRGLMPYRQARAESIAIWKESWHKIGKRALETIRCADCKRILTHGDEREIEVSGLCHECYEARTEVVK